MHRVLPRMAAVCCFLAALVLSPSCKENNRSKYYGREPTSEERQWFQDRLTGRWVVRFDSGATAVWDLKVEQVQKPMRSLCDIDAYGLARWVSSAYACGGNYPDFIALVRGKATSDVAALNANSLQGTFSVFHHEDRPKHISFSFWMNAGELQGHLEGTLDPSGTMMRGPAVKDRPELGAFVAHKEQKPEAQEALR